MEPDGFCAPPSTATGQPDPALAAAPATHGPTPYHPDYQTPVQQQSYRNSYTIPTMSVTHTWGYTSQRQYVRGSNSAAFTMALMLQRDEIRRRCPGIVAGGSARRARRACGEPPCALALAAASAFLMLHSRSRY